MLYFRVILCALILWSTQISQAQAPTATDFVEAEISSNQVFVGEVLRYTMRYHLALGAPSTSENAQFIRPAFSGFGVAASEHVSNTIRQVDNNRYTVIQLDLALYPLRPGAFRIEPFRVEIPETPFQPEKILESEEFEVTVLPLPEPALAGFINAVGEFTGNLRLINTSPNEMLQIELTIEGRGNVGQILPPEFMIPEGWQIFSQQPRTEFLAPESGSRRFRWTILPAESGPARLEAPAFTYFEPASQQYREILFDPLVFEISPSQIVRGPASAPVPSKPSEAQLTLKPLESALAASNSSQVIRALLWTFPPLLFMLYFIRIRTRASRRTPAQQERNLILRGSSGIMRRLRSVHELAPAQALETQTMLLREYLLKRTGSSDLEEVLKQIPAEIRQSIRLILQAGETARYAPVRTEDVAEAHEQIEQIIQEIERWRQKHS